MMQTVSWNLGWTCPNCSRCYSPITPGCLVCNNQETTLTTSSQTIRQCDNGEHLFEWGDGPITYKTTHCIKCGKPK